jgi:hypothetical protein
VSGNVIRRFHVVVCQLRRRALFKGRSNARGSCQARPATEDHFRRRCASAASAFGCGDIAIFRHGVDTNGESAAPEAMAECEATVRSAVTHDDETASLAGDEGVETYPGEPLSVSDYPPCDPDASVHGFRAERRSLRKLNDATKLCVG